VVIDAPAAGAARPDGKYAKSPLSTLPLATEDAGAGGAPGGTVGWLGVVVVLVLLVVGAAAEIGPPLRRGHRAGAG